MSYQAEISRANPTLFVFLLDQSGSMADPFGRAQQPETSKAKGVADAINRMLSNWVILCSQGELIRDWFEVAILGYGAQKGQVAPALSGRLAGKDIVKISEIGNSAVQVEDRVIQQSDDTGGIIDTPVKFPVWFEPVAQADTPMCMALEQSYDLVANWIKSHKMAFPPIVINLTDGEATDGDPLPYAQEIMDLDTEDGNVLLFNCHISSTPSAPILFPDSADDIPDEYGKKMFDMSSVLTPGMVDLARDLGYSVSEQSRGLAFQADLVDLIRFLDVGTRAKELLR